jgi:hypothetical protein
MTGDRRPTRTNGSGLATVISLITLATRLSTTYRLAVVLRNLPSGRDRSRADHGRLLILAAEHTADLRTPEP